MKHLLIAEHVTKFSHTDFHAQFRAEKSVDLEIWFLWWQLVFSYWGL